MPRDNSKWREAVRRSNDKPASGVPASGMPAGGAIYGAGHGAGSKKERAAKITSETAAAMSAKAHSPEALAKRADRIASLEEIKETLTDIMRDEGAPHMARIHAGDKLADRIEGKPVQRINANVKRTIADFTDDELAALASGDGGEARTGETEGGA